MLNKFNFYIFFVSSLLFLMSFEVKKKGETFVVRRNETNSKRVNVLVKEKCDKDNQYLFDVPLVLTKFIETGRLEEARCQSFVQFLSHDLKIPSHSGFFNVNSTYNSNMFFWFFPHARGNAVPLLLWSNGGPGTTSLEGLFLENGPIYLNDKMVLLKRVDSWIKDYNLLFIDTPIGAGFSFTDSESGYSSNTDEVSATLFAALGQFFQVFQDYEQADFYATSQSYGTKYMVSLGNRIMSSNSPLKQQFRGVLLLVPFLCPATHFDPKFHHQVGLIDGRQLEQLESISKELRFAIKEERMRDATALLTHTLLGSLPETETILTKYTGIVDLSNIIAEEAAEKFERFAIFVQKARVHLHAGNKANFHLVSATARNTLRDIPACELTALQSLLDSGARVLIVCGNLDAYVPCSGWDRILDLMHWQQSTIWKHTARKNFVTSAPGTSGTVSGYMKCAANLCFAVVRNAGHLIPIDQPTTLLQMMTEFTGGNSSRGTH